MTEQQWFVVSGGKEEGPFTGTQLKEMASSGKLKPTDLVRRADVEMSRPASAIKGLFPSETTGTERANKPQKSPVLSEKREQKDSMKVATRTKLLILSGAAGLCLFLCCGGLVVIGVIAPKTQKSTGDVTQKSTGDVLTADYLPCIVGNVKQYDEERFDFETGRPINRANDKITFHGDNKMTLEWSTVSPGQQSTTGKGQVSLEMKNGVIEWVGRIAIKVGARPGDEWHSPQGKITYKLVRFDKTEAKGGEKAIELQRAVIESQLESDDGRGGKTEFMTEYILEKGGGIQSEKEFRKEGGRKVLIRERRLISSTYK